MSNANVTTLSSNQQRKKKENAGFARRVFHWVKTFFLLLSLGLFFILGASYIGGKFITSLIETESDPRALASWGPGTSFISTSSGDTHILDTGEGDVVLLVHGSSGSIADWQESVVDRLADSGSSG